MESHKSLRDASERKPLLKVGDLCRQFSVSRDWIYKRIGANALDPLPYIRLGRAVRFDSQQVQQYLEARNKSCNGGSLSTTDGIAPANGRRKNAMARKRFQRGHVRLRKTNNPYWEGFFREDIRLNDGRVVRRQRAINLGRATDIPTKRLAQRKLADRLSEINGSDYRPRPVSTVGDFVETRYRKLILPLRKRTTQHSYQVILEHHILPEFRNRQLTELTGEDVQGFLNRKAVSGVAWNTVKNIASVLSAVYAAAVKYGYLRSNPVHSAELPQEPVRVQPQLPTDEELQRLQDALDEPHRTMVWLACATGVRVSELLALRWSAIDWERKCLWVREAVHDGKIDSPKTHRSQRPIRLTESDLSRLRQFRKRNVEAQDQDWLFPNTRGTAPFRADNLLERVIRPTATKLGITPVTWHLLRHWHTTVLHDEGIPIKVAQERLGHSRAETTMKHYVHLSQQAEDEAAKVLSRRLRLAGRNRKVRNFVSGVVSRRDVACA
jgi:integrase/predicted DNA-binding transcriptional regulator AlpA